MSQSKHTPGPWSFRNTSNPRNGSRWKDLLAKGEFGEMYIGEALEENAHLIAAAPELLAACKGIVQAYQYAKECNGTFEIDDYACEVLMTAIAKAEGKL